MSDPRLVSSEEFEAIAARYQASSASSRSYETCAWTVANDIGEGWLVASLGSSGEDGKDYYVVTTGVHASELAGDAKADAEFIANAPRDIKRLGTAYKVLEAENRQLREELAEMERNPRG
jgi:hypothetical protein